MRILLTFVCFLPILTSFAQTPTPCELRLGPDVLVCSNAQFTLNPNPVPGDYLWSGGPGLSCYDCPSPLVSGLTPGTYTFVATVTTPDCTASDTLQIVVINGQSPQYVISPSRGVCAGDTVHLGGPTVPGTFYNWFSSPVGFASFAANPAVVPAGPTTYYLSASSSSCPIPVLDSVKITPAALTLTLLPVTDTIRICRGRSRTLQVAVNPAGTPVAWEPQPGLQVSPDGLSAIAAPVVSTLFTVSSALGGCERTRQVFFAVDSLPFNLGVRPADTTICQGATVLLQSPAFDPDWFPGIAFKWTRAPATALLTPDDLPNILVQPGQTTAYRRVSQLGECSDTATVMVRVILAATLTAEPAASSICPSDSVAVWLTYTPGVANLQWMPASGLSCAACDSVMVRPSVSTTYTVSGTFQGCPVSTTVVVDLKPLAPLQFPDDRVLCLGDSAVLNEVFDPAATYLWTSTHPGFGTRTEPNPVFFPTQSATYRVRTDNGCIGQDSVVLTVNTAVLTASTDTTICKNLPATLVATTNIPGSGLQWQVAATGDVLGTTPTLTVMPDQSTAYVVVFQYADNCQLTDTVTVTLSGEAPLIVFPDDRQACPGELITLNLGPVLPGAEYTWTAVPPDAMLVFDDEVPVVSPTRTTTYSVTATLDHCVITRSVEVIAYRATLSVTPDTIICAESMVVLTAVGSDPTGRFAWDTGETGPSISKFPTGDTDFVVAYTFGDTCTLRDTVRVTVVPTFDLSIVSLPDTNAIDLGASVQLFAVVSPTQNLSNFNWVWQETTVDTRTLPFGTEFIQIVPATNDTTGATVRYTLTATAPNGCIQIAEKTFRVVFPLVRFPNAFTPDGDGNNDQFRMIVLEGLASVERMEIYNRWGGLVFSSSDPNAAWDGTSGGAPVPSDVYVYRVVWRRGDGALMPVAKGDVTVLR